MRQIWTGRVAQTAARYGDHAPAATVCCNACRTCITTNAVGLATGAAVAAAVGLRRLTRRYLPKR